MENAVAVSLGKIRGGSLERLWRAIYKSNVAKLLVGVRRDQIGDKDHPASAVAKAEPKAAAIKVGASIDHRLERIGTYVLADSGAYPVVESLVPSVDTGSYVGKLSQIPRLWVG